MTSRTAPAAIRILLDEHAAGYSRFAALEGALQEAARMEPASMTRALAELRAMLAYLTADLETHIAKEEGPLFPRLKAALPADDRLIDEMVAEHDLIRIKRDDLSAVLDEVLTAHHDLRADRAQLAGMLDAASSPLAEQELRALRTAAEAVVQKLRVHFENEEELVFPLAPLLLDAGTLDLIHAEMGLIA